MGRCRADEQDLQLQHLRLKTPQLIQLNFGRFNPHLKRLCLRQNEISSPIPPEAFQGLDGLEEIDLYDNRLGSTVEDEELAGCSNVTYVAAYLSSFDVMVLMM